MDSNILNFLRRRYEISKIEIAGTEVIQLYFNNGEVIINSLQNRKQIYLYIFDTSGGWGRSTNPFLGKYLT